MAVPFAPHLINAVIRHLNEDHAMDCLVVAHVHGGRPEALSAHVLDLDAEGADFVIATDEELEVVRIPFARVLVERADLQEEFARLVRTAYDA